MNGLSLRSTILLWLLLVSLTPVLLVGLFWRHQARESRLEFARRELQAITELQRKDGEYFSERLQEASSRGVTGKAPMLALLLGGSEALQYLQDFRRTWGLGEVLLLDESGLPLAWIQSRDMWVRGEKTPPTWDPELTRLARESLASGLRSSRSFDHENRDRAMLAQPIRNEKMGLEGVLVLSVELGDLLASLQHSSQSLHGASTRLVSHEGDVLAVLGGREAGLKLSPEALLGTLAGEKVTRNIDPLQGSYLSITRHMDFLGLPYTLVTTLGEAEALAGLERMEMGLLGTVMLVVLAAVLVSWFISHRLVEPLDRLRENMGRVADGHEPLSLPRRGPREIMNLIDVFQTMLQGLKEARRLNDIQFTMKRNQYRLTEELRGAATVEETARLSLQFLQQNLDAVMGAFYLVNGSGGLNPVDHFGIVGPDQLPSSTTKEGFLEQALQKARVMILRDLNLDRTLVRTGVLETAVNNLVVIPVQFDGQDLGIIELGLQGQVDENQVEYLELVRETVAVAINTGRSRERVNRLLRETWVQAETLSRHQKELRETNRELAEADRYKSEFLANMSHELRTPLNSLLIMAQVLSENRSGGLSPEEVDSARTIRKAGEDLLLLINDVLDLSKVEAGKMEIHIAPLRPADTLQELGDLFRHLARDKGLEWMVQADEGLPTVLNTDSLRLNQILRNILNNALKFTQDGQVTLHARHVDGGEMAEHGLTGCEEGILFEVRDTGIGMKPEVVQRIFSVFEQGDGSIGRRFGGSGLGLAISLRLTRILGGVLHVESEEGLGSVFGLYLPLEGPQTGIEDGLHTVQWPRSCEGGLENSKLSRFASLVPEQALIDGGGHGTPEGLPLDSQAALGEELDLNGRSVLLCDDDMRTVFSLTDQLEEAGGRILLARTWREGLKIFDSRTKPDVVILSPDISDAPQDRDLSPWLQLGAGESSPLIILQQPGDKKVFAGTTGRLDRPVVPAMLSRLLNEALGATPPANNPTDLEVLT